MPNTAVSDGLSAVGLRTDLATRPADRPRSVGSRRLARQAMVIDTGSLTCSGADLYLNSDAWGYVGIGVYRRVWLHRPTATVYKIGRNAYGEAANRREARAIRRASHDRQVAAVVPATRLLWVGARPIIAMEYLPHALGPGDLAEIAADLDLILYAYTGVEDEATDNNIRRRPDGQVVIIDWGGYS